MRREAELNAREAELRRWEADLRSSGRLVPKKNWPKCCPLTVIAQVLVDPRQDDPLTVARPSPQLRACSGRLALGAMFGHLGAA